MTLDAAKARKVGLARWDRGHGPEGGTLHEWNREFHFARGSLRDLEIPAERAGRVAKGIHDLGRGGVTPRAR